MKPLINQRQHGAVNDVKNGAVNDVKNGAALLVEPLLC